jgi:hypothetical protein
MVPNGRMPCERFAAMVPSAERIEVRCRRRATRSWFMMIKVTAIGGHSASRESAATGANHDRLSEPG